MRSEGLRTTGWRAAGLVVVASLAVVASRARAQEPKVFDHEHRRWTAILKEHIHGDRFDYAALKKDRGELDRYLDELEAVTPAELAAWERERRMAFWIDVYNAHVVALVLDSYPIESVEDLGSESAPVWKKRFIDLPAHHPSGKPGKLSLDDVEHGILRAQFADARIHAAINCAAEGCPPLRAEAYVASKLSKQLDEQCRAWVADRARNRFDRENGRAELSKVFEWFAADFERDAGSVLAWIARFAPEADAEWIRAAKPKIAYLPYSWKLNDVPRR